VDFFHNSIKHAAGAAINRIGIGQPVAVLGWPGAITWLLRAGIVSLWLLALLRQRNDADRGTLSVLFATRGLQSVQLLPRDPRLPGTPAGSAMGAALALMVLVLLPQIIALLASDVPGPASYAAISALFVLSGTAFLVGVLRAR